MKAEAMSRCVRVSAAAALAAATLAGCSATPGRGEQVAGRTGAPPSATPAGSPSSDPRAVPEEPTSGSWRRVQHLGVRLEVPADWVRSSPGTRSCLFHEPSPAGAPGCAGGRVAFLGAATFDPVRCPDVSCRSTDGSTWEGFVHAHRVAVVVIASDRDVVDRILGSVRPRRRPVGSPVVDELRTVEQRGVRVDIPSGWVRSASTCPFRFQPRPPSSSPPCTGGVAFYAGASFDAAHGPGVHLQDPDDPTSWGGYVSAGEVVVYVSDPDRRVVADVLGTVRPAAR